MAPAAREEALAMEVALAMEAGQEMLVTMMATPGVLGAVLNTRMSAVMR